jgi:hypothetical protein
MIARFVTLDRPTLSARSQSSHRQGRRRDNRPGEAAAHRQVPGVRTIMPSEWMPIKRPAFSC